jgi:omega-6 fatty acid desaturase (delta-12 desaturase)
VAIPNYNLRAAHEQTEGLSEVPELTLRDALRAPRLKLWDERRRRLVTFADARASA